MKTILVFSFLINCAIIIGQNPKTIDFTKRMEEYDISKLWTLDKFEMDDDTPTLYRNEPLGYIGENYQRFQIHFISAIKNPDNKLEYFIYGKTKSNGKICTFQGTITIVESKIYKDKYRTLRAGFAKGKYKFYEDPNQKGTGMLKGTFQTDFYINQENRIKYDDLLFDADDFRNNQFFGMWTTYNTKNSKECNWGDYRIPYGGGLDVGPSYFIPNEKYKEFGWENYIIAYSNSQIKREMIEARKKEREKWWLEQ
ncbi:MAG: hypothetical protein HRT67_04390 [Flavobacteriaceae bacterium]|nr:hypothetical protein [Flavobacteriaceae bacterium]